MRDENWGSTIRLCIIMLYACVCANHVCANVSSSSDLSAIEYVTVQQIIISGNKVTKAPVILNELGFKQGDMLMVERLGQIVTRSRHNLLNTSLFNYVSVRYTLQADGSVIFHVAVEERWYWWVFPIFEVADRNLSAFFNSGDWSRVNYGVYLKRDNFRGRNERVNFRVRLGYTTQLMLSYNSPEYKKKTGWGFMFDFRAYDQLSYKTMDNQQVFKDFEDDLAQVTYYGSVYYSIRSGLYKRHQLSLVYNQYNVNDSITLLNPDYLTKNNSRLQYFELKYNFDIDKRDSKVYPLRGNKLMLEATKEGFGLWDKDLNNIKVAVAYDSHNKLADRLYWSSKVSGVFNTGEPLPYFLKNGLGYKSFINGYELYVVDGPQSAMMKNQMIFTLLKPRIKEIGFMPLSQFAKVNYAFYLKTYCDFGHVWQKNPPISNTFVNDWLYGYGVGLDFVTFYDMVWSVNYSINKQNQHGLFIHFNLAM